MFAIEFKTAAQESTPKYYKSKNGTIKGINIDIMKAIEKVDSQIKFVGTQKFIPFKRIKKYLSNGELDVFFGLKKTEEREENYIYLDTPLYEVSYVLANRVDDNYKITSFNDIFTLPKNEIILSVSGTGASKFLYSNCKVYLDDNAKNPTVLLKMLMKKRGRYAFYHDLGLLHIVKSNSLEDKIRILPTKYSTYSHYVAFSKKVPLVYIQRVRIALKKLEKNGTLKRIYETYR